MLPRKIRFEEKRFEVHESSAHALALLLILLALLGAALYFFAINIASPMGNGRYVFVIVLGFLFLGLVSGLLPLLNDARRGNRKLVWGATSEGLLVPCMTTTFVRSRPPVVYAWGQIKKLLLVDRLITHDLNETNVSFDQFVVVFDPREFSKDSVFRLADKMKDGAYCMPFPVPKAQKAAVLRKIRELVPRSITVEELAQYEVL